MTREEELKQIKKESAEIEKHMTDMFDLAFMLNNRNDIMNPQAHYEKISRMVTHYMGSIQQSYGYMSIKVIEALEQEPCVEPLERLAESAAKTAKTLERLKVSEQEPIEVEATKLQMAYNQGFEDCRKAVIDELKKWDWQELYLPIHFKENIVDVIPSVNPQEPKYCDRNICIKNEYNGIGCDECEVTKSQEPKTGHWKPYLKEDLTNMCSECGSRFDRPWNYCPHCGAKMAESEVRE